MKDKIISSIILVTMLLLCLPSNHKESYAESKEHLDLTTTSTVNVDLIFGEYQAMVDENLYYSLCSVNEDTLVKLFGNRTSPMFIKAKETINPLMAFATMWGESGRSWPGVSLTNSMDFNPDTYKDEIDWVTLSKNIEQVDSSWYIANVKDNYNTNTSWEGYRVPIALIQHPQQGSRKTDALRHLGVGPYQHTSTDWKTWSLDERLNPVWGWEESISKVGTAWLNSDIRPISDITVYACLSLGHQGGNLITLPFGKELIEYINQEYVQDSIYEVAEQMYRDALAKASKKSISLSDINTDSYRKILEEKLGIKFSKFHKDGYGATNKGNYVIRHVLQYVFYKYYFTSGF